MMIGDGGQSGFDVSVKNFRFHTFTGPSVDVNFNNGAHRRLDLDRRTRWLRTPAPQFYAPVISDPKVSGTMFAGTGLTAYRTKTFGLGSRTIAEANAHVQRVDRDLPSRRRLR